MYSPQKEELDMNFYINQSICINYLKIGSVTNSSVLQIGSAGIIKPLSNLYNSGGYTGPAPQAAAGQSLVPLAPSPAR
jgi:spore germination protein PB